MPLHKAGFLLHYLSTATVIMWQPGVSALHVYLDKLLLNSHLLGGGCEHKVHAYLHTYNDFIITPAPFFYKTGGGGGGDRERGMAEASGSEDEAAKAVPDAFLD